MVEAVAVLGPFMQKLPPSLSQNEFFGLALRRETLIRTIKHLFIMINQYDAGGREFSSDSLGFGVVKNAFLYIKMRKKFRG